MEGNKPGWKTNKNTEIMTTKNKITEMFQSNKEKVYSAIENSTPREAYELVDLLRSETSRFLYSDEMKEYAGEDKGPLGGANFESNVFVRELYFQLNDLEKLRSELFNAWQRMASFGIRDSYTID